MQIAGKKIFLFIIIFSIRNSDLLKSKKKKEVKPPAALQN